MRSHLLWGWIMILILAAGPRSGVFRAGEALVCTNPVRLEIGAGQSETLQILLVNADRIYGIDLQAGFDPAVVEIVDSDSQKSGIQMLPGGFLKADFTARNQADNKSGTLHYVATQLNPTPPSSGTGIILTIRFRGKKVGAHTSFTFTSAVIADRRGIKRPVTTQGGELVIVKPRPSTPTPVILPTHTSRAPAFPTSTFTQAGSQSTQRPSLTAVHTDVSVQPSATVILYLPPVQSGMISIQKDPIRSPGADAVLSDRLLAYITVGGFSGAILLFALTVLLLAAKRRKHLPVNDSHGTVGVGGGRVSDPGINQDEGSATSN